MPRLLAALLALLLALVGPAGAQELQPVPALTARVIDQTGTLRPEQLQALQARLAAFEAQAGTQIAVLLVPTTAPEDVAAYAHRVADQWKIGRREIGDGLLIVVAKDDRRVRIEVAKTLEGAVPDLAARQVIDRAITPAFRAGDFYKGLDDALTLLMARIRGEKLPTPPAHRPGPVGGQAPGVHWDELALFFFAGVPIIGAVLTGMLGRKLGSVATAGAAGGLGWLLGAGLFTAVAAAALALVMVGVLGLGASGGRRITRGGREGLPPIIWGGGGFGGFGGGPGGFGNGGFRSGGGGDFGGGGASGGW